MDQTKIGQYIAGKRKALGMTQEQLADKIGKSQKAVSKWERGVCLPDVSVYTELCGILGITLNEFFAGEDIEPADVEVQSERNLLGVAADGSNRSGRLKKIVAAITAIAIILAAVLGALVKKEGYLLTNYIKVLDESTQEGRIADTVTTERPLLFSFELDEEIYNAHIFVRKFKNGVDEGCVGGTVLSFTDEDKRKGTIAIVSDTMTGNYVSMILSTNNGKISWGMGLDEISRELERPDNQVLSLAGQSYDVIKVRANEEIPLGALYVSTREGDTFPSMAQTMDETQNAISSAAPECCYLFSVRYEDKDTARIVIPDLTGMSLESAMEMIKNSHLTPGNIQYHDVSEDEDVIVYKQNPQLGSSVAVGTAVDISVCKKTQLNIIENTDKLITINAENTSKDTHAISAPIEIADNSQLTLTSNLAKGSIRIELIPTPENRDVNDLQNANGETIFLADIHTGEVSSKVSAGSYLIKATCVESADGVVQIEMGHTL